MMSSTPPRFFVLTNTVLNCDGTGYRGIYRADPATIAFSRDDMTLMQQLDGGEDLWDLSHARAVMECAKKHGIACEVVKCTVALPEGKQDDTSEEGEFLGYDVAQPWGDNYSVIVDRCMDLWVPSLAQPNPFATFVVVAEYFNALLNPNKLFDDIAQAQRFLQVDRELASRFGGEMSCELAIVSVHLVR